MRLNLIIVLVMLAALAAVSVIYIKQGNIPEAGERASKLTEWMRTYLALTDEQAAEAGRINLVYANKVDEIRAGQQPRRQKLQALKVNQNAKDAELKGVFTTNQYQIYLAKKQEIAKEIRQKAKQ